MSMAVVASLAPNNKVGSAGQEIGSVGQEGVSSYSLSRAKRVLDLILVVLAAPSALLIVGIAGLAIALSSGTPVFFMQDRVGLRGRRFRMIKLRTMAPTTECHQRATSAHDNRVTRLGAILRQYRIDELPQLLNVLKGDMSLIGPRPEQPALVDHYRSVIPGFDERHLVKPGITGLAQVMYGYAGNTEETRTKFSYDQFYVRNACPALEARIALKTVGVVLRGQGAR
jgi:lipopolysaccharide/colanic/teichoic acid biosynthesis glycosyltransferase